MRYKFCTANNVFFNIKGLKIFFLKCLVSEDKRVHFLSFTTLIYPKNCLNYQKSSFLSMRDSRIQDRTLVSVPPNSLQVSSGEYWTVCLLPSIFPWVIFWGDKNGHSFVKDFWRSFSTGKSVSFWLVTMNRNNYPHTKFQDYGSIPWYSGKKTYWSPLV